MEGETWEQTTTTADRATLCGFCHKPIAIGDEIGFGTIKNKAMAKGFVTVPICLSCWDRQWFDRMGGYNDAG